ncbi:hypothetical protein U1Q18_043820 [Sarracenia purpurea var. burkii]
MLFFSYFKDLVGREVTVELKNDLAIRGTLHSVDQYLNIKLENTRVVDQDKWRNSSGEVGAEAQSPARGFSFSTAQTEADIRWHVAVTVSPNGRSCRRLSRRRCRGILAAEQIWFSGFGKFSAEFEKNFSPIFSQIQSRRKRKN